jgi:hypothetical protein
VRAGGGVVRKGVKAGADMCGRFAVNREMKTARVSVAESRRRWIDSGCIANMIGIVVNYWRQIDEDGIFIGR